MSFEANVNGVHAAAQALMKAVSVQRGASGLGDEPPAVEEAPK
jgi:hypothetical protein